MIHKAAKQGASWQFSLRALFLLTLSVAALAALARVAAQLDVLVLGILAPIWNTTRAIKFLRHTRRVPISTSIGLVLSWCILYVVSAGPALLVLDQKGWMEPMFARFYAPLDWIYDRTPLRDALEWYLEFWWGLMFRLR